MLHLVRDPRAVTYSWIHQAASRRTGDEPLYHRRFGPAYSASRWLLANLLSEALFRKLGTRYRLLRYEDLVQAPLASIAGILDWVGEPGELPDSLREGSLEMAINHTISGNPNRFRSGKVALRLDDEWRLDMCARDRSLVEALT